MCAFFDQGLTRHERTHTEAYICILCGKPCYSADSLIGMFNPLYFNFINFFGYILLKKVIVFYDQFYFLKISPLKTKI